MTYIKERPIIFNAQEVNAVLAGNKSQHRFLVDAESSVILTFTSLEAGGASPERIDGLPFSCPLGETGDRLWVQELHARTEHQDHLARSHYYAGNLDLRPDLRYDAGLLTKYSAADMPRWASRILLEITDIRIERMNDISEDDAIAEGVKPIHSNPADRVGPNHFTKSNGWYHCSRPTAAEVFKEIYKVSDDYDRYGENPWVWVVEFKVIEPSED